MEKPEIEKRNREISPELQLLFWVVIFSVIAFVGYQVYSAFSPEAKQEASLFASREGDSFGDLAPDFTAQTVQGETISLADFRDKKPVLLVFWATWCGFCAQELPELKAFTNEHQGEIEIMVIASGESKETVQKYIEENNINFPMLLDEKREIWSKYPVRGTPTHFLISKEGRLKGPRPGVMTKEELAEFSL